MTQFQVLENDLLFLPSYFKLFQFSLESSSIMPPGFTASRLNSQISGTWELPKHPTWCTFSILSHFSGTVAKGTRCFRYIYGLWMIMVCAHVLSERLQHWHHPPERFNMLQSMLQIGSYCEIDRDVQRECKATTPKKLAIAIILNKTR